LAAWVGGALMGSPGGGRAEKSPVGGRILIVDDQEDVRLMLQTVLSLDGWDTEEAASGEEAVARVDRTSDLDALVVDYKMPDLDGVEVTRRIRRSGFARPIIICSAYLNPDIEREASALGAHTVSKDDLRDLRETIRRRIKVTGPERRDEDAGHLAAIVESADDAIIGTTLVGMVGSWNPAAERIFGYSAQEMIGRPIWVLVPADHDNEVPEILQKTGRGERVQAYETVRETKDGRLIDVLLRISPIKDREGNVVGASTIARNVTGLNMAERRMRAIVDSAHEAFVAVDRGGAITDWNPHAERTFGWTRAEALGRPLAETLIPSRYREAHVRGLERFLTTGEGTMIGKPLELEALHRDGRELPVELTIAAPHADGDWQLSAFIRDISQRKHAEENFQGLLESAPDAMVIVGADGLIALVNRQTEQLFGYRRKELLARPVEILVPGRFRDRHPHHRDTYFADPKLRRVGPGLQLYARRKDGTEFPVEISLSPLKTVSGTTVSAAIRDVTERKRAEELQRALAAEQEAAQHLRDLDRLKDEFLGTVSHELRTPLTVIAALAEVLGGSPDREDRVDLVERIFQNASAMGAMIEQLLDYSRLEAGKIALEVSPLPLRDAVLRCIELAHGMGGRQISLEVPDELMVQADARGFDRILVNLLDNAAKFSPEATTIQVTARAESGDAIIAVEDEGIGIPPQEQERVFERFHQGAVVSGKRGTGIGLSIVRRYVELLGGKVWVESTPGQGAKFLFTLPLSAGLESKAG
jgi:PAS domain S-box-containing protein